MPLGGLFLYFECNRKTIEILAKSCLTILERPLWLFFGEWILGSRGRNREAI